MVLDRRGFLVGSAAVSAAWLAACAHLRPAAESAVFRHGVASGDPLQDGVILWTRVSAPDGDASRPVPVHWRVARDPALRVVVARGNTRADASRDFTLKIDQRGLAPGTSYYYAFEALGETSAVGRTRTLPTGSPERLRLAFASCASLAHGFFNAYGLIARRADLDAVLHLGDYIYEYANGAYGDGTALGRVPAPDREVVTLADYRTRHAQYKRDPDLQELHRQHPVLAVWDDHESANNAWKDGAQNHQRAEGDWLQRRQAAVRAYREWMPIRDVSADAEDRIYRSFRFGDLVELLMLDTRLLGRDRQLDRRDPSLSDSRRTLLGDEQERWLFERLSSAKRDGVAWRVVGQQVMMAALRDEQGDIYNPDAWDGYPSSRARFLEHLARHSIDDTLVLTGDVHSSWANDLPRDPFAAGAYDPTSGRGSRAVELIVPGISSPGTLDPERAAEGARSAVERHPHVKWVDLSHRGYALLDIDRERAQCEWWFTETVSEPRQRENFGRAFRTLRGSNHLQPVSAPSRPPRPAAEPAP